MFIKNLLNIHTKRIHSPINGPLSIGKSFGTKALIANGIPQSGGEFTAMWQKISQYIVLAVPRAKSCLVLGVAGGTAIEIVTQKIPSLSVVGVEIDPLIIDLAKKQFGWILGKKTKIIIANAQVFVAAEQNHYDIIIVDLYIGDRNPSFSHTTAFLKRLKALQTKESIIVINKDYQMKDTTSFEQFLKRCRSHFTVVEDVFQFPKNHIIILR